MILLPSVSLSHLETIHYMDNTEMYLADTE